MKRWILPAIVIAVVAIAVVYQYSRPARQTSRPEEGPKFREAPTNVDPRKPDDPERASTTAEVLERWRKIILRGDAQSWFSCQAEILADWPRFRPHVLQLAEHDPSERVRARNLNLFIVQKERELVPFFAERLRKDPSVFVKENCCRALGEFGAREHRDLVRGCLSSESRSLSNAAREALAKMGETP